MHSRLPQQLGPGCLSAPMTAICTPLASSLSIQTSRTAATFLLLPVLPARQQNLLMPLVCQVIYDSTFVDSCWISWFFNLSLLIMLSDPFVSSSRIVIGWFFRLHDCSASSDRLLLWRDFQCRWFVSLRLRFSCVFRVGSILCISASAFALICSS